MASTTFWARLIHGNKKLQLDEEPYMLAQSFSPPAVNRSIYYSEGSGRGKDGGKRVSESHKDRGWSFNIRVQGDTEAEVLGYINRLVSFLENASDTLYPLQFEYYPYSATGAIPLWGQGVYRYTIKEATCQLVSPWLLRDKFAIVAINTKIAPVVDGQRQRLALASGGIYEDTVKTPDGLSRGVQVCTAGTNVCTNPVFSHATWNTGWTASADCEATKITDRQYPLFGDACVKIQHSGVTAGTARYTTTMTTGASTYIFSAYVKLLDERAPGTADMQFWCRGTALGAFNTISVGDGWYRIWDTATCPSAAGTAGIQLMNSGAACYMDGFQMEAPSTMGTAPTPLMHGDSLGCAWSGTRGASTTVRTAGVIQLPSSAETINSANSSVRAVVKWNTSSATISNPVFIFSQVSSGLGPTLYWTPISDIFAVEYESETISGGTVTFSSGDITILHYSYGRTASGGTQAALYVNGTLSGSSDILDLSTQGSVIYIGADYSGISGFSPSSFLDFVIFDRYLTAAEVAADYAEVYAHVTGGDGLGQALSRIPYLWTKDGDGVVDSVNDSDQDDFAIAHGIPGNMPAHTIFDMRATFAGTADGGLMMANQVYKDLIDETNLYQGATVTQNVGTTAVAFPTTGGSEIIITRQLDAFRGQKVYALMSLSDAGSTYCKGRMKVTYDTATNAYYSDYTSLSTDGTAAWFLVGPIVLPDTMPVAYDWMAGYGELDIYTGLVRTSGSGTITMNSFRIVPGDFMYIPVSGLTTNHAIIIDEDRAYSYNSSTAKEDGMVTVYGDVISLVPGKYNHLVTVPMAIARDSNLADTVTFSRVYITPRYALL